MNHFTSDDRYFAKHYTQYGMIPTDKELPYKASENSACGKYVHPDDDNNGNKKHNMKRKIKLTESQLNRVVKESMKAILKEESINDDLSSIIQQLKQLTQSGWIPFASPAPSSTELRLKTEVLRAIECLEHAEILNKSLYGYR